METQINPKCTTFRAKNLERRVLLQMTLSKNWRTFGKRTRKTPSLFPGWFSTVEIDPSHYCVWNATNHITSNKHPHQVLDKSRPGIPDQTCNIGPPHILSHMNRIHIWRPRNYASAFVLITYVPIILISLTLKKKFFGILFVRTRFGYDK